MPVEKIIVEIDLPPDKALLELAYIMKKLRYHTKHWEECCGYFIQLQHQNYGAAKIMKKDWEARADAWMLKHIKPD